VGSKERTHDWQGRWRLVQAIKARVLTYVGSLPRCRKLGNGRRPTALQQMRVPESYHWRPSGIYFVGTRAVAPANRIRDAGHSKCHNLSEG
jgi:hypothetical protein